MLYGLMDCNNFFVSCERVFRPDLEGKPVVVLSNNDGCIVSRSNEAKEMAIPMGLPFFQLRDHDPLGQVTAFSSNYVLYADLSKRVMSVLADMVCETMPYSIDECFFTLDASHGKAYEIASSIPARVRKWTGIPVSVGLAPTKTLAKMACRFAKKYKGYNNFCAIDSAEKLAKALRLVKLEDVWGIGRRTIKTLNKAGLFTAADFCNSSEGQVRKLLGINGLRTWKELRGEDSVKSDSVTDAKQSICTSRSFAEMVTDVEDLRPMVANFASQCASKLRAQGSVANIVSVFVSSNAYREDLQQYSNICNVALSEASASQIDIVRAADRGLLSIFRKGVAYKKAGVILSGIAPEAPRQLSLFAQTDFSQAEKKERLSKLIDKINGAKGMNKVHLASQMPHIENNDGKEETTAIFLNNLRRDHISPRYTTDWNDIIRVKS
ncbi:MAG: Y-family DNA polymerase [Bacteroidales bacterium]|nr:Y-family DNA polymerase [Bacteroidales bacterium]